MQVVVEKHRHEGVFIARGKEDALVTRNMVPGESVYGEKRISTEARVLTWLGASSRRAPCAARDACCRHGVCCVAADPPVG